MMRPRGAPAALWLGGALVVLGLARVDAFPARRAAAAAPGRQDGAKLPAQEASPGTRSVRDGVFSEAQAGRGDKTFRAQCGSCHKPEQFTGAFLDGWQGQAASGLFALIRTSMPEQDPGGLPRQDYADILAFIFKTNGLPAGPVELPSAATDLRQIVIDK